MRFRSSTTPRHVANCKEWTVSARRSLTAYAFSQWRRTRLSRSIHTSGSLRATGICHRCEGKHLHRPGMHKCLASTIATLRRRAGHSNISSSTICSIAVKSAKAGRLSVALANRTATTALVSDLWSQIRALADRREIDLDLRLLGKPGDICI